MMACAPESVFTPKTTRGGAKAAWVTQLTVAAATAPFLPSAVKTYRPYGIIRNAVFLASSFITHLSFLSMRWTCLQLPLPWGEGIGGHVWRQRHPSSHVVYTTNCDAIKAG